MKDDEPVLGGCLSVIIICTVSFLAIFYLPAIVIITLDSKICLEVSMTYHEYRKCMINTWKDNQ